MRIYRYWAKVYVDERGLPTERARGVTGAAGWSDDSFEAATASALNRAQRFAAAIREGAIDRLRSRYAYFDRPVREPIVDEVVVNDQRVAAITRNAYGAYILNSAGVLFADIDRRPSVGGAVRSIWNAMRGRAAASSEQVLLEKLEAIARTHDLSLRVYRTRGGHRACVTSRTFHANDAESQSLLEACGSDPLYVRLCAGQQCYRARLSPKPWRIGLRPTPRFSFPYHDDAERERFDRWSAQYEQISTEWTACESIADLGDHPIAPEVEAVLKLHDTLACTAGKPLA